MLIGSGWHPSPLVEIAVTPRIAAVPNATQQTRGNASATV
jgi:hypothetical protein